uniref:Uncharacterized protein n=1 Tax=Dictyoglomus thermophilum TaxID=14 RepID=A0A7C3RKC3_DICTH
MEYVLDENSLSIEDLVDIVKKRYIITLSETLSQKVNQSNNLLNIYIRHFDSIFKDEKFNKIFSSSYLNKEEKRSIIITLIYTASNGNSGISYKTIKEIITKIGRLEDIDIPETSLSPINMPPYGYILSHLDTSDVERRIILKSKGYYIAILALLYYRLEIIRKILSVIFVLYYRTVKFQNPYIDPYILASNPHLSLIKLGENINILTKKENDRSLLDLNSIEISFHKLCHLYDLSYKLKEILNIELNSSQFPIIFNIDKENYVLNPLNTTEKYLLTIYLENITKNIVEILSTLFPSSKYKLFTIKNSKNYESSILYFKETIRITEEILSKILLELLKINNLQTELKNLLINFLKEFKIKTQEELTLSLENLISFLENQIEELY